MKRKKKACREIKKLKKKKKKKEKKLEMKNWGKFCVGRTKYLGGSI